jgi:hypothetical protein
MTLTGGTTWGHEETLTLTAAASYFVDPDDVGNEIHFYTRDLDGNITATLRCEIISVTSGTVCLVKPSMTVPVALRAIATSDWAKAVDELSGLEHLEGEQVGIFADGFVVASPKNSSYTIVSVEAATVILERPYAVIHVGLPITSDLETLNIDNPEAETLSDKKQLITKVTAFVESSRGFFVGGKPPTDDDTDPLEDLIEMKLRDDEGYNEPPQLQTGTVDVNIINSWNSSGRVFIRQVDPVPISVLSVIPAGMVPVRA